MSRPHVNWEHDPISVHHEDPAVLESVIRRLEQQGVTKHSIVMPDRSAGGFLFFIYQMVTPANFQFEE